MTSTMAITRTHEAPCPRARRRSHGSSWRARARARDGQPHPRRQRRRFLFERSVTLLLHSVTPIRGENTSWPHAPPHTLAVPKPRLNGIGTRRTCGGYNVLMEGMAVAHQISGMSAGAILRKELADVMARMRDANPDDRSAFLNHVHQTIDRVIGFYLSAWSGRKAFLEKMRKASLEKWNRGDWPTALGLGISCLNAESRFIPARMPPTSNLRPTALLKKPAQRLTAPHPELIQGTKYDF